MHPHWAPDLYSQSREISYQNSTDFMNKPLPFLSSPSRRIFQHSSPVRVDMRRIRKCLLCETGDQIGSEIFTSIILMNEILMTLLHALLGTLRTWTVRLTRDVWYWIDSIFLYFQNFESRSGSFLQYKLMHKIDTPKVKNLSTHWHENSCTWRMARMLL